MAGQAREEVLVPVVLDLALGEKRLQDSFNWPLKFTRVPEQMVFGASNPVNFDPIDQDSLQLFATQLCAELDMPSAFDAAVAKAIRSQLNAFQYIFISREKLLVRKKTALENWRARKQESAAWISHQQRLQEYEQMIADAAVPVNPPAEGEEGAAAAEGEAKPAAAALPEPPAPVEPSSILIETPPGAHLVHKEERVTIWLDIAYDGLELKDCFEWDVLNPSHSIEEFAKLTATDLGLPRDFENAIALEMRRQIYFHTFRSAYDEAAAWDRGLLQFSYWMEPLPGWAALRSLDSISSFQPSLRPLNAEPTVAALSAQEVLRNPLVASAPGRSAIDDAIAAQTSSDPRRLPAMSLPANTQPKRSVPVPVAAEPISGEQQSIFTAELQRIMGPLTRRTGRGLFANVNLFDLEPPIPPRPRDRTKDRDPSEINENDPSWMRPRDPHSGRFLTKKEIEALRRKEKQEPAEETKPEPTSDTPAAAAPAPPVEPAAPVTPAKPPPKKKAKTPKSTSKASSTDPSATPNADGETPKRRGRPPKRKNPDETPATAPAASATAAGEPSIPKDPFSIAASRAKRVATNADYEAMNGVSAIAPVVEASPQVLVPPDPNIPNPEFQAPITQLP